MTENEKDEKRDEPMNTTENSLMERSQDIGFWKELLQQIRLVWYLLRDPEVPLYLKLLPLVAVIYVIVPTDLIPDIIPAMGQLDDITALIVGAKVFIDMAPPHIVSRYVRLMRRQDGLIDLPGDEGGESVEDAIIIEGEYEPAEKSPEDLDY